MENTAHLLGNVQTAATALQHAFAEAIAAKKPETTIVDALDPSVEKEIQATKEFVNTWVTDNAPITTHPENMQSESFTLIPTTDSDFVTNTDVSIIENNDTAPSNPVAQTEEDEGYPDPTKVLEGVEDRLNVPRKQKSPIKKHKDTQAQGAHSADHKPVKRPAIFGLAPDREAGQLLKNIFNPATLEGQDGVDHINIHNDAATELGRFLDMNAKSPFNHPELGMFQSVGGVWHYIQTQPLVEEYRILTGAKLRAKVAEIKKNSLSDHNAPRPTLVKGFRIIVADAMWHKVTQSEKAVQLMAESSLPFEHYFVQGDMKIRQYPSEGYWIIAAYEEIRRVIKARLGAGDPDEQPDFSHIETLRDPRSMIAQKPQRRDMPYGQRPRGEGGYFNQNR